MDSVNDNEVNELMNGEVAGDNHGLGYAPIYTVDSANGYQQTKAGIYYKGKANSSTGDCNDKVYFLLENPDNSRVNILVNKVMVSNLDDAALSCESYLCAKPRCKCMTGGTSVNSNTQMCYKNAKGRLYTAKNLALQYANEHSLCVAEPYSTFNIEHNGSILLAPGRMFIIAVDPVLDNHGFKACCSFEWWEESI